ncbi:hypothetical protein A4X20_06290 [Mycolicibacterium iranicum]|uniref:Uncharacterized protein n=1 Tax=Mycolicibacterium iranicum TaxID=912594 RepID=A0A178LS36_MYCIR|nr:hypothetical protein A4X20_06290 [Mycolicibacterium iranicum]
MDDCEVFGRIVWPVDAVTNIGRRGQCLEAMEKSRRHVEMPETLVVQPKRLLYTECGGSGANVD